MPSRLTSADIEGAAARIRPYVRLTPVIDLGDVLGKGWRLSLKLDTLQPTGSFKVRGAFSVLTATLVPEAGVVAASGGNFGAAIAHAAGVLGHKATVFVPSTSPEEKLRSISGHGADVHVISGYYADALESSRIWAAETGAFEAHAFDQLEVVAGQGTCGMEIMDQVPGSTSVLVPVGGGGLIAGIANWVRSRARVVGVEPEACPTMHAARQAGGPVEVEVGGVAASSLGSSRLGDHAWTANQWVDASILVSDDEIIEAQQWLWETCRIVAEPGASVPVAALLFERHMPMPGEQVVVVVSGANTSGVGL